MTETNPRLEFGEAHLWRERGAYPDEPIHVHEPGVEDENSGVLLSVVLDTASQGSYLLVLDPHTMQERARARVPHAIPYGLHGEFCADESKAPPR